MEKIDVQYYLDDEHQTNICSCEVSYVAPVGSKIWLTVNKKITKGESSKGEYIVKSIEQCVTSTEVKNGDTYSEIPANYPIGKTSDYLEIFLEKV